VAFKCVWYDKNRGLERRIVNYRQPWFGGVKIGIRGKMKMKVEKVNWGKWNLNKGKNENENGEDWE
jgi:hypothetical protein